MGGGKGFTMLYSRGDSGGRSGSLCYIAEGLVGGGVVHYVI